MDRARSGVDTGCIGVGLFVVGVLALMCIVFWWIGK